MYGRINGYMHVLVDELVESQLRQTCGVRMTGDILDIVDWKKIGG